MKEETKRTEISQLGEFKLIEHLTRNFGIQDSTTVAGVGDDAAVIQCKSGQQLVLSTDLMVEGIHFDLMYHPLKHLGYKAVSVNVSDICAMNALAAHITVSIAVSNRFSVEALEELYQGIQHACQHYGVDLVGGDTASSQKGLIISVTATGFQAPDKLVYRKGAKRGDHIFVSGELGGAYLGLQLLEREKQLFLSDPSITPDLENQHYIVGKFLKPEARKDMIFWLQKAGVVPNAMIDISDGLSSDLMHICAQSHCGALIEESLIPIHEQSQLMALKFNMDPVTCALNGGEDYELLMVIAPEDASKVRYIPGVYYVGEIRDAAEGIMLKTNQGKLHKLTAQGWTHFQR